MAATTVDVPQHLCYTCSFTCLGRGRKKLQAIRAREGVQDGSSPKPRTTLSAPNSTPKNQTNGRVPSGTSKQSGLHSAPTASRASQSSGGGEEEESARSEMLEINDFLFRAGVDNVNIFRLQRYMRRSEICRKVRMLCSRCDCQKILRT